MIKINLKSSWILNDFFLKTGQEKNQKKKEREVKKLFNNNKSYIFKMLKKITKLDWKRDSLDIWIIGGTFPTSPFPNFLNVNESNNYLLFDIIYLLIHNLLIQNDFYSKLFKDEEYDNTKLEAIVFLLTKKILEGILTKKELIEIIEKTKKEGFNQYIWDEANLLEKNNKYLSFFK
ncbi:MAG: hypothetical protein ABIH25_05200 [Candidatus Woesearchaeota archaeon]